MNKVLIFASLLLSLTSQAQLNQYDSIVKYYHQEKNFNGAVLVATNGKVDYLHAEGKLNRQTNAAISTCTKFKIASVTKAFTAVLIMQLYQEGKIDLKEKFGVYFPAYKGEAKDKVTIENLLTYGSAISDDGNKAGWKSYQTSTSLSKYIDDYCSGKLEGTPGTTSIYSNTEYIILTKIIENVTGKKFEKVLEEKILQPLSMKNSGMLTSKKVIAGLAKSYTIDSTQKISADEPYLIENFFGAGAMYATVEDLLKFDVGIFTNKLLNKANTALLIAPNKQLNNVAFGVWYASGYGIFSKPFIYRTGGILGACSNWIHTIDDKKTIIVFNSTNGTNLYELSEKLYAVSTSQTQPASK